MKKAFWKLVQPQRENFLQVLHDGDVSDNTKATSKIRCKAILKMEMRNAKLKNKVRTIQHCHRTKNLESMEAAFT